MGTLQYVLFASWAVSLVLMVILILMHSGKGGAFSDSMATSLSSTRVASSVMEHNLNVYTNIAIVWFLASIIACILFFPQGVVGY